MQNIGLISFTIRPRTSPVLRFYMNLEVEYISILSGIGEPRGLASPRKPHTRKLADAGPIESLGAPLSLSLFGSLGGSSLPPSLPPSLPLEPLLSRAALCHSKGLKIHWRERASRLDSLFLWHTNPH